MLDSTNFNMVLLQLYGVGCIMLGFWFGQRGLSGVIADIRGDIASLKARFNTPVTVTPTPVAPVTPVVTPVNVG